MSSRTPLATPLAPAPNHTPEANALARRTRRALLPPVTVTAPLGDVVLDNGSLLLGRLPECDIQLHDTLTSRIHARISVQDGSVILEDLHSSNGVYVNGERVGYSLVLREGDRILIGGTEICLFEARDTSLSRIGSQRCQRTTPPESPLSRGLAIPTPKIAVPKREQAPRLQIPTSSEYLPTTARSDALNMIGRLAEQLAACGDFEEAARLLSGHLRRILKGANSGLSVPGDLVDSASSYALILARWTNLPLWADYVVELHIAARLVMTPAILEQFEAATLEFDFDRMLLGYYVEHPKGRVATLDADERQRIARLKAWT
jgi:pSer/pThr/pTyr-binding forkhead associated (FHA) protein